MCFSLTVSANERSPIVLTAADATAELKKMSMDELKEKGERYQQLLEERALADVLYS